MNIVDGINSDVFDLTSVDNDEKAKQKHGIAALVEDSSECFLRYQLFNTKSASGYLKYDDELAVIVLFSILFPKYEGTRQPCAYLGNGIYR